MDVVNSTLTNVTTIGLPQAAHEARKDSLAQEAIPKITQNNQSQNNGAAAQNAASQAPSSSNLFIQTDVLIKTGHEKVNSKKDVDKNKKNSSSQEANNDKKSVGSSTSGASQSSAAGGKNSANLKDLSIESIKQVLSGAFGKDGVDYSIDADNKRQKGESYKAKTIANRYGSSSGKSLSGNFIDTVI